jgi:hypothetical protein
MQCGPGSPAPPAPPSWQDKLPGTHSSSAASSSAVLRPSSTS